jgi:hypothetical protein
MLGIGGGGGRAVEHSGAERVFQRLALADAEALERAERLIDGELLRFDAGHEDELHSGDPGSGSKAGFHELRRGRWGGGRHDGHVTPWVAGMRNFRSFS